MTKAQMYEYIGSNLGKPKKVSEEERQSAEHFSILEK